MEVGVRLKDAITEVGKDFGLRAGKEIGQGIKDGKRYLCDQVTEYHVNLLYSRPRGRPRDQGW